MTTGASSGEANPSLRHDIRQALSDCLRLTGLPALDRTAGVGAFDDLAEALARNLGPRIGGRYIPKSDHRPQRSAEVIRLWDEGVGREEILRASKVSRRLYYMIIGAEQKRRQRR